MNKVIIIMVFFISACVVPGDRTAKYMVNIELPPTSDDITVFFYLNNYEKKESFTAYKRREALYKNKVDETGNLIMEYSFMEPFGFWLIPPVGGLFSSTSRMFLLIDFEKCVVLVSENKEKDRGVSTGNRDLIYANWYKNGSKRLVNVHIKDLKNICDQDW